MNNMFYYNNSRFWYINPLLPPPPHFTIILPPLEPVDYRDGCFHPNPTSHSGIISILTGWDSPMQSSIFDS